MTWLTHASQHIYCIYCIQCNVAMPWLLRKYNFSLRRKSSVPVGSKWGNCLWTGFLFVILFTCYFKLECGLDPVSSKMTLHRFAWVQKTKSRGLTLWERQKLLNLKWSMVLHHLLPVRNRNDLFVLCQQWYDRFGKRVTFDTEYISSQKFLRW